MDQGRKEFVSFSPLADGVRILTLDRSAKANALNAKIVDEFLACVTQAESEGCRAVAQRRRARVTGNAIHVRLHPAK